MKALVTLAVMSILSGCGPDRTLLMETRFDAPLREKIASLAETDSTEELTVVGRCSGTVDAALRQELINAGAEVLNMTGETFTARVSSDDIFSVAALERITRIQLSQSLKPHSR